MINVTDNVAAVWTSPDGIQWTRVDHTPAFDHLGGEVTGWATMYDVIAAGPGLVAVGRDLDLLGPLVTVELPGGALSVAWNGGEESVWMTGPAERTFQGSIEL